MSVAKKTKLPSLTKPQLKIVAKLAERIEARVLDEVSPVEDTYSLPQRTEQLDGKPVKTEKAFEIIKDGVRLFVSITATPVN